MQSAIPLMFLLHFHRMMSNSVTAATITIAPTPLPVAKDIMVSEAKLYQQRVIKLSTYVYGIVSLLNLIHKICCGCISSSACYGSST